MTVGVGTGVGGSTPSTSLFYISLLSGLRNIDNQHRNTNMNDKDHLVGQLTGGGPDSNSNSGPPLLQLSVCAGQSSLAVRFS